MCHVVSGVEATLSTMELPWSHLGGHAGDHLRCQLGAISEEVSVPGVLCLCMFDMALCQPPVMPPWSNRGSYIESHRGAILEAILEPRPRSKCVGIVVVVYVCG